MPVKTDRLQASIPGALLSHLASSRNGVQRKPATLLVQHLLPYATVTVLALLVLAIEFEFWRTDLRIPLWDIGDGVTVQTWVKSIQEHGWYLHNPSLGAPGAGDIHDYPMPDNLNFFIIKLLGIVIRPHALLYNVFCFLMFPVIACTSLYAFRRLRIDPTLAMVGSLLYAFLPYHVMRMFGHVFLASYYLVPLQALLAIDVATGKEFSPKIPESRRRFFGALILCLLVGSAGVYYAFFGCYLNLIAGLYSRFKNGSSKALKVAVLLCACTGASVLANLVPNFVYRVQHGRNPESFARVASEAEVYGLKIVQLLLPATGHYFPPFAKLKNSYNAGDQALGIGPLINENDSSSLGLIGAAGFLLLLWQLFRRPLAIPSPRSDILACMAILNLAAILLATTGGLGVVFNMLISSMIRAYTRICVFIAFFSLVAVLFYLEPILRRICMGNRTWQFRAAAFAILVCGLVDQTPFARSAILPKYKQYSKEYPDRAAFVARMENGLPKNAMVFQLPYLSFPESWKIEKCNDGDLFKPYLVSNSLHWSYGAIRGREADHLGKGIASFRADDMVRAVIASGYLALFIDRAGYADFAETLEDSLTPLLGFEPLESGNGRWAAYSLVKYKSRLEKQSRLDNSGKPVWTAIPPHLDRGFYSEEKIGKESFRWCNGQGTILVFNADAQPRQVTFQCELDRPQSTKAEVHLIANGQKLPANEVDATRRKVQYALSLAPGVNELKLDCDGARLIIPGDSRKLAFRAWNVRVIANPE